MPIDPVIDIPVKDPDPIQVDLDLNGEQAFNDLDAALPVLLLPIRLETRFDKAAEPPLLHIRVYPDTIHTDALTRGLTATEEAVGKRYWTAVWDAPTTVATREAAFRAVNRRLGARRGAFAVRELTPANLTARVSALTKKKNTHPMPAWPTTWTLADLPGTPSARLLPKRWIAVGFQKGVEVFRQAGSPISSTVNTGPDHSHTGWANADVDDGMNWMIDYEAALAKGMAITVTLDNTDTIDKLFVLGVASGTTHDAAFVNLLKAHHYTRGAAFVPSGTATNNTDGAAAGYSAEIGDMSAFVAAEIPPTPPASTSSYANASVLATALGIADATLLHRLDEGEAAAASHVRAMNQVLWHCSIGALVRRQLAGETSQMLADDSVAWLEKWFVDRVHAPGPLPALRVGPMPYGVLPVMVHAMVSPVDADSREENVRTVVANLTPTWDSAVSGVPVINADVGTEGNATANIDEAFVDILSMQPDASRFNVRELEHSGTLAGLTEFGIVESYGGALAYMQLVISVQQSRLVASPDPSAPTLSPANLLIANLTVASFVDIDAQIAWYANFDGELNRDIETLTNAGEISPDPNVAAAAAALTTMRDTALTPVQTLLAEHKLRVDPLRAIWPLAPTGVVGADGPAIYYGLYKADAIGVVADLVQAGDAGGNATAGSYLAWLADQSDVTGTSTPENMTDPPPLLFQLAREALIQAKDAPSLAATIPVKTGAGPARTLVPPVGITALSRVRSALNTLAALPVADLELRMQQTLGLATHRLDAWHTALATRRLERLRDTTPTGLQVGAYGWVHGLSADAAVESTQGYIHAPSLQQAVTAAVLRSGWLAHRDDDTTAFGVNLESARIRRAAWLFSGVRHGQSIARLLGYQFERALHDNRPSLDSFIDDFRTAVNGSSRDVVDGLGLLDNEEVQTIIDTAAAADRVALKGIFNDVAATLDAAADTSLAEAAHRLLMGDTAGTVAVLSAISNGEAPPPQLDLPRTPRPGIHVTHRLMVLLADNVAAFKWAGAATSFRAKAAPALELWAEGLLGTLKNIGCTITFSGLGAPQKPITVTLDKLTLDVDGKQIPFGALDFAWMAPAQPDGTATEMVDLVRAWLATSEYSGFTASIDLGTYKTISIAEALTVVRTIRAAVAGGRPGNALDLAEDRSTVISTGINAPMVDSRATASLAAVDVAIAALEAAIVGASEAGVRAGLAPFGGWQQGVWAAMRLSGAALLASAATVLATATAHVAAARAQTDTTQQLASIAGFSVPLPFVSAGHAGLATNFASSAARQGAKLAAVGWLNQVDRVREGAARMSEVLRWSEALLDTKVTDLAVLQLPDVTGEPWAGLATPAASRISIVVWPGTALTFTKTAKLNALMLDEWVETIPSDRQVTGLTFGVDAPVSRPPQAALLAVADALTTWSLDRMVDTLLDTWQWMKRRAVDPDQIEGLGHYLPGIFSDTPIAPGDGVVNYAISVTPKVK